MGTFLALTSCAHLTVMTTLTRSTWVCLHDLQPYRPGREYILRGRLGGVGLCLRLAGSCRKVSQLLFLPPALGFPLSVEPIEGKRTAKKEFICFQAHSALSSQASNVTSCLRYRVLAEAYLPIGDEWPGTGSGMVVGGGLCPPGRVCLSASQNWSWTPVDFSSFCPGTLLGVTHLPWN